MQNKTAKFVIASVLMVSLSACASNNNDNLTRGPRNVANNTLNTPRDVYNDRPLNIPGKITNNPNLNTPRNVYTGDLNRPLQNKSDVNWNPMSKTTEIQPMNNGFITIEQNSYSTTTPSRQFPHTKRVKQGQFWYYTFDPEISRTKMDVLNPQATIPGAAAKQPAAQGTAGINQLALQVIDLTNKERRKNGLSALKTDLSLSKVAQTKTNDMNVKNYFSHTSPTYGSPFDMMRDFGVTYRTAGENIAMGQVTAQQVVNSWMNSEGHRKNILNPDFTSIGVGYTSSGNYWSQMFIGK